MTNRHALLLIDLQNDFLPGGALAVPDGDAVIAVANRIIPQFELVFATQDWHPAHHGSFASQHPESQLFDVVDLDGLPQTLWPDHCIQNTHGAEFSSSLQLPEQTQIVQKGTQAHIDSYSGFFDNGKRTATGLHDRLQAAAVDQLFVLGLATDYCVKFTVLDALDLGWKTTLIEAGCRGVNLKPGDVEDALDEMRQAGANIIHNL